MRRCRGLLEVELLSCCSRLQELAAAANEFRPPRLVVTGENVNREDLLTALDYEPRIFWGEQALTDSLTGLPADLVLNAVSGIAGLPLLAACLEAHMPTALSNKESIVAGADVIRTLWEQTGTPLYPVDSEHAAIYECLGDSFDASEAAVLWLTASGGPFLDVPADQMAHASREEALAHPTWNMGPKITVDSATMANKGLEVIEARYLFGMEPDQIRIVIQPGSLVHSMVQFRDTTVLAQIGLPDMRVPIERALLGRDAGEKPVGRPLDFWEVGSIGFRRPDLGKFPCIALAYEALREKETAVFNAADDEAVALFLAGRIELGAIPELIERALAEFRGEVPSSVEEIMRLDSAVRTFTRSLA